MQVRLRVAVVVEEPVGRTVAEHILAHLGCTVVDASRPLDEAALGALDAALVDSELQAWTPAALDLLWRRVPRRAILTRLAGAALGDASTESVAGGETVRRIPKPLRPDALVALVKSWASTDAPDTDEVLDPDLVAEACMGDSSMLPVLASDYIELAAHHRDALDGAVQAGDLDTARTIAHRLAGSLGLVGARRAMERARALDRRLREGPTPPDELAALHTPLHDELGRVESVMRGLAADGAAEHSAK